MSSGRGRIQSSTLRFFRRLAWGTWAGHWAVTLRMSKATQGQEQNERGTGTFHLGSIDFGYGKGAGEYDLIVDFDQNGIVALILELEPVDVVDQIDPVMGAGGFESPVDYDRGSSSDMGKPIEILS